MPLTSSPPPVPDDEIPALADSQAPAPAPVVRNPGATDMPAESSPPASRSGSSSTGGFDTMLGRHVVKIGLVTEDELEQCRSLIEQGSNDDTLADLLLEQDFLTKRQLDRIRRDFEASRSGKSIPGYHIMKKLGSGAMATVFLAKQKSLQRLVAIKLLPKRFSEDPNYVTRFLSEGRAAAKLNHPNIVQAYDVNNHNGRHYFVMEYVEGNTVYDRIQEVKRLDEQEAIDILIQASRALQHAHQQGFIHRDIKPKNLMLTEAGQVKVADLGLARGLDDAEAAKKEAGRAYGTPYYISPEQIRGRIDIGPSADIYGLGATAYHMVTGHVPFTGKNPNEVMQRHLRTPLTPPDQANPNLSANFCQVLEMMMEKDATDRYQSAADLLEDLDLISQGRPPHFARPKLDLADLAVQVPTTGGEAPLRQKTKAPGAGPSPLAIGSMVLNGLLLIVLVLVILTR